MCNCLTNKITIRPHQYQKLEHCSHAHKKVLVNYHFNRDNKAVECKGCMTFVQFKEYELECCILVCISCFEDLYKKFRIKCCHRVNRCCIYLDEIAEKPVFITY